MVKKGDTFQTYSDELKIQVVKSYLNGEGNQSVIAKKYQLRSRTQLMNWVRKYQETGDISDWRGQNDGNNGLKNLLKGRSRMKFDSIEELEYYKAQVAYLKKQYSNL
ncbi:helix-turn-helix domain-containing protein [Bacillus toyonensis]|uniref:Transposase n=1 Tax=Bacillus toyonensis TaxID=155322 RepID=A0A2A8H984_9BACI|nr:helix-turn-helix domain-containing protein [Bacillus toyonensis]PEP93696.1 transposase [Bacillus toyonensis]